MPATPEIPYGRGEIRLTEILSESESHATGGTDSNERITSKIGENLEAEKESGQKNIKTGVDSQIIVDSIDIRR